MIAVFALVAVAAWQALIVLDWIGGREARQLRRWIGGVFVASILIPLYLLDSTAPLDAVVDEIVRPIIELVDRYTARLADRS